mgnify:CR=1 FL=1
MKNKYKNKILNLFKYAESVGSDLSHKILDINNSTIDNNKSIDGESISIDLIDLIGLVDPEFVKHDLKIDTVFVE